MIWGTSKIWSKSGPVDLLTITKMAQRIQGNYGIILKTYYFPYLNFPKLRNSLKSGLTKHLFVLIWCLEFLPPKIACAHFVWHFIVGKAWDSTTIIAKKLCLGSTRRLHCIFWFFWGLYYSKMAN